MSTSVPTVIADQVNAATKAAIERFNEAFGRHDVDGIMAAMTEDCVFDSTPAPDGERYAGQAAVRGYWERFFAGSPAAHFAIEEAFAAGDRCVVRFCYSWVDAGGRPGHVRGVDLFRVKGGKVAEKLCYVKG